MPRKPSSPSFATTASGIQPSSSQRPALGARLGAREIPRRVPDHALLFGEEVRVRAV